MPRLSKDLPRRAAASAEDHPRFPAGEPDAALLRLAAEITALMAEADRLDAANQTGEDDCVDQACELRERLADMRATTVPGFRAKAVAWSLLVHPTKLYASTATDDLTDHLGWSIHRDLLGLPMETCDDIVATWHEIAPEWPTVTTPSSDAKLIALCTELRALQDRLDLWNDGLIGQAEGEATHTAWWGVVRQITALPATTPAGIRAKATMLPIVIDAIRCSHDADHEMALSLVRDLLGESAPTPLSDSDAELIRACDRFIRAEAEYERLAILADHPEDDQAADAALDAHSQGEWSDALDAVGALPALTYDGLRAKARAYLAQCDYGTLTDPIDFVLWSVLCGVAGVPESWRRLKPGKQVAVLEVLS